MAEEKTPWIEGSELLSIFPTFVWKTQVTAPARARIDPGIARGLAELRAGLAPLSRGQSWQSGHDLHTRADFGALVECVQRFARSVLAFLKVGQAELAVTGCWANVNGPGAAHRMHSHPNNYLSGVYYVQTQAGADAINFHDPRVQTGIIRPPVTELTAYNTDQAVVQVANGTLLLFPAWLVHSVDPNRSEDERVSVSFNLMFTDYTQRMASPLWEGGVRRPDR